MNHMRHFLVRPALAMTLLATLAGCDDVLSVEPTTEVEERSAIVDAGSARSALAGAYDAMQSGSYYGGDFLFFTELPTDNADHTGTFTSYADVDLHVTAADNGTMEAIWDAIYDAIGRANVIIARIPAVTGLDQEEKDDMVGQAHLMRALHYHNLVKLFGGVPLRLQPPTGLAELANTERATVDQVYTQILADLTAASQLISNEDDTRRATVGAVDAIRSRVLLFRQNWVGALAAAENVVNAGYELAPAFGALFTAEGNDTVEDIWRVSFTPVEFNVVGYYYFSTSLGGRRELAPTSNLANAFTAGDARRAFTVQLDSRNRRYGSKLPTSVGAEDLHVIRFAEVLLNKAEALARLNRLAEAVDTYNLIRERAGLVPHVLGTDVATQGEVLAAIWRERRLELAYEGDRWPELVRTGRAESLLGIPAFRTLFPIPQNEVDVAPRIIQNAGY
jgi:hypothetical protein